MIRLPLSAVLAFGLALSIHAAPSPPAQPADPTQARPALPVTTDDLSPTHPDAPSTNSAVPIVPAASAGISIIAESSLKAVLAELTQTWADNQDPAPQVPISLTNSGTICATAERGPGFDVVISADVADIKTMTDRAVLLADDQRSLARNSLVVYGRKALVKDDDLEWFDLIGSEWKKIAMGNSSQVASGRVASRALQKHGLLDDDHKSLYVYGMTDALALAVLQRDQADAVFAYKTDAAKLNLHGFEIYPISSDDAPPIFYTAAVCRLAKNPTQARAFIDFCTSDAAKPIWVKYGFETN